jgi:hypothetical protein
LASAFKTRAWARNTRRSVSLESFMAGGYGQVAKPSRGE